MNSRKKELGQFFTAPEIAEYMAKLAYFPEARTVLDPAVGPGILVSSLQRLAKSSISFTVYDLDAAMLESFRNLPLSNCHAICADYLLSQNDEKYDIILCNPPYNRFQDIPDRKTYIRIAEQKQNVRISGFANLCVYFLVKSIHELNENGRCVYIMPYEFLNCGYGTSIKRFFMEKAILKSIIKFDSHTRLFPDAVTTSCILVLENAKHDRVEFVTLRSLEDDSQNARSIKRPYAELDPAVKWNVYFKRSYTAKPVPSKSPDQKLVPFHTYATVRRGIATGNNPYFTLSSSQANALHLSNSTLIKCICKAPTVKTLILTAEVFDGIAASDKKAWLFDGTKATTPDDHRYIRQGESLGIDKKYLTSHRMPWYKPEHQMPAPIWISVFNREHVKVIRNEAGINTLTTFHCLYLNTDNEDDVNLFFCYLITPFAQEILYQNKREYGSGLEKFEPSDLKNAMVLNLSLLKKKERSQILKIYERLRLDCNHDLDINELNNIFLKSYLSS